MIFSRIIGQDHCIDILKRTLAAGRIANAYLFSGVEGCGKSLTARAFVAAIYCRSGGCGECGVCRRVMEWNHPDLHMIRTDDTVIKIAQIRELQQQLALRPCEAPRRACIIDGAEKLNQSSGNALLKTLEEPPGDAVLILLTTNEDGVLPTIRSRCRAMTFSSIPEQTVRQYLVGCGFPLQRASLVAGRSGGSLARAIALAEEEANGEFLSDPARALENLSRDDAAAIVSLAEEVSSSKERALDFLERIQFLLRELLRARIATPSGRDPGMDPIPELLLDRWTPDQLDRHFHAAEETRALILRNVNPQLAVEVLLLRMVS